MHCILHIGTEKTATTLIQKWLYENRDQLSAQRVALTKKSDFPNNRKLVTYIQSSIDDYLKVRDIHNDTERHHFFENFENDFANELSELKKDHETAIFTSEHFHSRLTSESEVRDLKAFLDQFFNSYSIICYFREQSKVRTSLYSTGLKINNPNNILDFQSDIDTESHYYNYLSFFKKWENAFGKDALLPRIFSKENMIDGDIRKDFIASVLPKINAQIMDYKTDSSNESLSADEAVLFREINAVRNNFIGRHPDPTPDAIKNAVKNSCLLDKETSISDPRQNMMYDTFNDVNVQFFSRYFGEKENMFPRPKEIDQNEVDHKRFNISDLADFLNSILSIKKFVFLQDNEVNFLRDLAIKLHSSGAVSNSEAITLLKLANRARPAGGAIISKLDELRNED